MPWVVGIDEAGYGPNLGPLVQAAVALRLPAKDLPGWKTLKTRVRRAHEPDDGRVVVDDSKAIYQGGRGLQTLAAALQPWESSLSRLIAGRCLQESQRDCLEEYWHEHEHCEEALAEGVLDFGPRSVNLVMPARFNRIVDEHGNKAIILMQGFLRLTQAIRKSLSDDEPLVLFADKHGGRHYYAALLQDAFPGGWVVTDREGPAESRYRIMNLDRDITVIFRPKADADSVSVALASMTAKHLRELCMKQFNAFWARHVPGIKPTAGYPGDARRFYREIEPAMQALGISPDAVWRIK